MIPNNIVDMWIYESVDQLDWTIVEPKKVPGWIRFDPQVIENLVNGLGAQAPGQDKWFIGIVNKGQVKSSTIKFPTDVAH